MMNFKNLVLFIIQSLPIFHYYVEWVVDFFLFSHPSVFTLLLLRNIIQSFQ